MSDQSMRGFVEALRDRGELVDVEHPIAAEYELSALLGLFDRGPAVRASNVTGSPMPVVGNLLNSRERLAAAVGCEVGDLLNEITAAIAGRQAPEVVTDAPAQEVVLAPETVWDQVIAPKWFEQDSGGYVTAGLILAHDPVTGMRNASYARVKPLTATTGFIGIAPNHHLTALSRSAGALPVALAFGVHPAIQLASCTYLGLGDDELEHASHLLGETVRVVRATTSDVLVPADAEVVVEGLIHPDQTVHEGLVNEYHGMYEDYGNGCTLEVTAVTMRRDASMQVILPGLASEHSYIAGVPIAAGIKHALRGMGCEIVDVAVTHSGGGRVDVVVSIAGGRPGVPRRIMMGVFAAVSMVKQVTVVDADVDVWDDVHVHWARTSRMRWDRDLVRIDAVATDRNVPMQEGGTVTKVGMDATVKPGDRAVGPQLAVPPAEVTQRVLAGLPDATVAKLAPALVLHASLTGRGGTL